MPLDLEFLINLKDEAEFYNHVSEQFNEINGEFYARANRALLEKLHLDRPAKILDLACGTGHLVIEMAKRSPQAQVVGVDLSTQMLEQARQDAKSEGVQNVEFIERDIHHILSEFKTGDFDIGVSCFALSYLGCDFLLKELWGILGPKGQIGITTSSLNSLVEWQQIFLQFFMDHADKLDLSSMPSIPEMPANAADLQTRLEQVGFEQVQVQTQTIDLQFATTDEAASFLIASGWLSNQFYSIQDKGTRRYLIDWAKEKLTQHHGEGKPIQSSIEFLVAWNEPG